MEGLSYGEAKRVRKDLETAKDAIKDKYEQYSKINSDGFAVLDGEQLDQYRSQVEAIVDQVDEYDFIADIDPQVDADASDEAAYLWERETTEELSRAQNMLDHLKRIRDRVYSQLDDLEQPRQASGWDTATIEQHLIDRHGQDYEEAYDGFVTKQDVLDHVEEAFVAGESEIDAYNPPEQLVA